MEAGSTDSIDLQELAVRVIRYFSNHLKFILIGCTTGLVLGAVAFTSLPTVYESQMVVLSDVLTKTYGDRMDKSLNNLIKEGNIGELSAKLNLPPEKVMSLRSVEIVCEMDVKSPNRDNVEKDETFFFITVELTDRSALPDVQESMIHYLRTNEWAKKRAEQRSAAASAQLQTIDRQLRQLDSLKQELFQNGRPRTDNIQFDPSMPFKTTVEMTGIRWKTQAELELADGVLLVEGFTVLQKPKSPKLSVLLGLGFLLGLSLAVGLLTLKHLLTLARK